MDTLTAEFVVNTPLFIGGADPENSVEIRAASIKGAIRFWWRALMYSDPAVNENISRLKKEEDRIFGSTAKQAAFHIQLSETGNGELFEKAAIPRWMKDKPGLIYLAYGVADRGKLVRPCLMGAGFTLRLVGKTALPASVKRAVELFGLIGGLGSKSRKGYGSVTLTKLAHNGRAHAQPDSPDAFKKRLESLLPVPSSAGLPEISAFSRHARVDLLHRHQNPLHLMNAYGETMQLYRDWGFTNSRGVRKVNRQTPQDLFRNDHDWFKNPGGWRAAHRNFHPERIEFGLPQNYFSWPNIKAKVLPAGDLTRRASPLFYHVHRFSDSDFAGISILLKSRFLPVPARISADGTAVLLNSRVENFDKIVGFLTGTIRNGSRSGQPYFPNRHQII